MKTYVCFLSGFVPRYEYALKRKLNQVFTTIRFMHCFVVHATRVSFESRPPFTCTSDFTTLLYGIVQTTCLISTIKRYYLAILSNASRSSTSVEVMIFLIFK